METGRERGGGEEGGREEEEEEGGTLVMDLACSKQCV